MSDFIPPWELSDDWHVAHGETRTIKEVDGRRILEVEYRYDVPGAGIFPRFTVSPEGIEFDCHAADWTCLRLSWEHLERLRAELETRR
jgi:hypothetical protein